MNRFLVLFLAAVLVLAQPAPTLVPSDVVSVTEVPLDATTVALRTNNLTDKTITCVIARWNPPIPGAILNVSAIDWGFHPLLPHESRTEGSGNPEAAMHSRREIAAVIFDDGTVIGSAVEHGIDFVDDIFRSRRANLGAWLAFDKSLAGARDVHAFVTAANALQHGKEQAHESLRGILQTQAGFYASRIAAGDSPGKVQADLDAWYGSNLERAKRLARRAP
jgi:hypothetical protein